MKNKNIFEKSLSLIQNKKQLYFLLFLSLIGVFVELLSIAIVIPVVVFLIEQNPLEKFQFLEPIFNFLSISNKKEVLVFSLCLIDGILEKNSNPSSTVMSRTSAIDLELYFTSKVSLLYLFPLQISHST